MDRIWVIPALISAFSLATSDAFTKNALRRYNEYLIAWLRLIVTLPFLIIILLFIPVPVIDNTFYIAFSLSIPLEILATFMYIRALRISPMSLTLPLLSLTPVFLIFVPKLLIGERVSSQGAIGVIMIGLGGYVLNIKSISDGILEPVKALTKERGSLLMAGVAFIYSITSTLGKIAINHSSALFFGTTYFIALTLIMSPICIWKVRNESGFIIDKKTRIASILPGIFQTLMIISHMIAISMTNVAYMISVKRLSLVIGVIYGLVFFKEKDAVERLTGSIIMFTGFVLIVLYG